MTNRQLFMLALAALGLLTLANSVFTVDQRERAVVRQFGEIISADFAPGLHFKVPFVQTSRTFDGRLLTLDNQTESFLTLEKKNVKVDFSDLNKPAVKPEEPAKAAEPAEAVK